jgi:hypothetical protein
VIGPNQKVSVVEFPQIGPGNYEARFPLEQDGTYTFRATGSDSTSPVRSLEYSYPAEYHFYPPDTQKLRAISNSTGGIYEPQGPEIFDTRGESTEYPLALWPWLSATVLILYIADILLRRVRLFEAPPHEKLLVAKSS